MSGRVLLDTNIVMALFARDVFVPSVVIGELLDRGRGAPARRDLEVVAWR